jgi:hypothetical protein
MSTFEKLLVLNFSELTKWLQILDFPLFSGGQLLCTALYPPRTLGIVLLKGPRAVRFLVSEVPL